jgi:hypothetical protein
VTMDAKIKKQLERLQEQQAKIKAEKKRIMARLNQEERKKDTRKKNLIGAAVMNLVKQGKMETQKLNAMMDGFLTQERDRSLFGLPNKANKGKNETQK